MPVQLQASLGYGIRGFCHYVKAFPMVDKAKIQDEDEPRTENYDSSVLLQAHDTRPQPGYAVQPPHL